MKFLKFLKEKIALKPKIVIVLTIIFLIVSLLSALTSFEMYLNEEELLKENFQNNEVAFYLLFIVTNGLSIFFFFLAKGLWKLKEWARYFILGSSFFSSIYVIYHIVILSYIIVSNNFTDVDESIKLLFINILYFIIYISLLKYFSLSSVQSVFSKNIEPPEKNFFTVNK